jgi:predicted ATPase
VERTGERHWLAELHRLRGELLQQQGEDSEAETNFLTAIEVARQQQAKSWELRAALSLSRLWSRQGRQAEAKNVLAPVYNWFTEGFETADLVEARQLLEELSQ